MEGLERSKHGIKFNGASKRQKITNSILLKYKEADIKHQNEKKKTSHKIQRIFMILLC